MTAANWRADFPLFEKYKDLAYLDSAATSQRPYSVLERVRQYYEEENANPLRGLYQLSLKSTKAYEDAREAVARFVGASDPSEIIFVRNATEALNLIANSFGDMVLKEGDEILISILEHHSNLLPWQQAAKRNHAVLKYVECDGEGNVSLEAFREALTDKTRLVSMTGLSNVLGNALPIKEFAKAAHEKGAFFVCDGAQMVPHMPVNVQELDVDFLVFSGHKMLGPMGIGALYGKQELLEKMPPFLYGGEMIEYVTRQDATYAELPHKFEAGTVNAGGAAGFHAAIAYYEKAGFAAIEEREKELSLYAYERLSKVPFLKLYGSKMPEEHHGIFTFTLEGVHPHDISEILSADGVCIRAGHHCAQPLMKFLKVNSTARASLSFYNTEAEIDKLADSLASVRSRMGFK